ncbi:MAG: hypothetical protein EXR47_06925 [Dehalococcoidia bacterium]|nr:hypothetical protein [Dehalococcoidia bacterium]
MVTLAVSFTADWGAELLDAAGALGALAGVGLAGLEAVAGGVSSLPPQATARATTIRRTNTGHFGERRLTVI